MGITRKEEDTPNTKAGSAEASNGSRGISGSTLKLIALAAMLIDHTAAIVLDRLLLARGMRELNYSDLNAVTEFMRANGALYYIDMAMRMIGRLGFPIFCFLLVEGFVHTSNIKKYAFNMGLFALLSEIPFDLAFSHTWFSLAYQNVFFTLFFGLLVLIGFRFVNERCKNNILLNMLSHLLILAAGMALAFFLKTDYKFFGVLTIAIMYLLRRNKLAEATAGCAALCVMSLSEITAFFSLIPIHLYNGKRGFRLKYVFYIFYPAHILLLHLVTVLMGTA